MGVELSLCRKNAEPGDSNPSSQKVAAAERAVSHIFQTFVNAPKTHGDELWNGYWKKVVASSETKRENIPFAELPPLVNDSC